MARPGEGRSAGDGRLVSTASGVSFDKLCRVHGVAIPVPEYRFALAVGRQWRFDWAWPAQLVALEVEGGAFIAGRHTRGSGFAADLEKYNAAAVAGWLVLRVLPKHLARPSTFELIAAALARRASNEAALLAALKQLMANPEEQAAHNAAYAAVAKVEGRPCLLKL